MVKAVARWGWWGYTIKHPITTEEAVKANGLISEGKTVFVEVANQHEMCLAKEALQSYGNITFRRKDEGDAGCVQFGNAELEYKQEAKKTSLKEAIAIVLVCTPIVWGLVFLGAWQGWW